ncbi:MAG TPA: DNA-binding transcriptional regulator [Pirellulaceae bacterium]|jgi:LacI family transcriptional regulator|nr:DNA-binding transcriptional regulator [Pirellulaceae bacterium]
MQRRRSVALLIETSNAYARGVLEGALEYVRRHEAWSLYVPEQERGATPPDWLSRWKGDGIIARIETDEIAAAVRKTRLPVIDVSAARICPDMAWVETNDEAIARLAADHLIERGFRDLAFCGDPGFNWSVWRRDRFVRIVQEAGRQVHVYDAISRNDPAYSWTRERQRMTRWIRKLPKPIGIMACYDIKAQQLLDVCRDIDVAVPEEIAVIGVDNDPLVCELASPRLSSVIPNVQRTGYEAARLLDRMMAGEAVPPVGHLIDPLGVETRQSTDVLAIDDREVASALRYIRENACFGMNVADILKEVPVSRRVLESRFRKLLGRTPHQEIQRLRIDRVKHLLAETDMSLAEIANRSGFEHVEYLSFAFKRETGQTPSQYRRSVQGGAGEAPDRAERPARR